MPLPEHLTPAHLRAGVIPTPSTTAAADHPRLVATALDDALLRLAIRGDLLEAWRGRIPLLPPPPRTRTLQEAVQAARARLRTERATADRLELDARAFVVGHLRDGLA